MYWPLGVASVFSVPRTDHDPDNDNPENTAAADDPLISLSRSASSNLLASVTATELFIWQTQVHLFLVTSSNRGQPMAVLASLRRSQTSLENYGNNVKVILHVGEHQRTEAIVSTSRDFLIIYSITISNDLGDARYKLDASRSVASHRRRSFVNSTDPEIILPYLIKQKRMIKVDSRLSWYTVLRFKSNGSALPLDDQLVIATERPPAIQCVLWQDPPKQSFTDLISKMDWMKDKGPVRHMVFDKPTSLFAWVTKEGKAYAVRKPGVHSHFLKSAYMHSKTNSRRAAGYGKGGYFMINLKIQLFWLA
jgi:RAB6A-GEF complex partner protein 1